MSVLERWVDERFLQHRLRSSSAGGIAGGLLALGLFSYRYYVDSVWSWDLLAVASTVVCTKVALMIWYRVTD